MKVLVLDDNPFYANLIKNYLEKYLLFIDVEAVTTFREAKERINEFDLFIIDYILPECPNNEHIEYVLAHNKKVILITSYEEELLRSDVSKKILEYVYKDDFSLVYLKKLINRIYKNRFLSALVVDDSKISRNIIVKNLKELGFEKIYEVSDGKEALKFFEKVCPNIVITDLNMPQMNGVDLVKEIRKKVALEEIPILIISSTNTDEMLIKTLKLGANDYIVKPFKKAEFFIRVMNILDVYDTLNLYKTKMYIDPLTGAYNRLYLEIIKLEIDKWSRYAVVMMDIDHFKKINDTYGHLKGDEVLKHFVSIIKENIRKSDYLVRYGGEEFLIILPEADKDTALKILQKIKLKLISSKFDIPYTFSAGVADEKTELIEKIKLADERLYKAKESGRNRFVID